MVVAGSGAQVGWTVVGVASVGSAEKVGSGVASGWVVSGWVVSGWVVLAARAGWPEERRVVGWAA